MKILKILFTLTFIFVLTASVMAQEGDEKWRNFEVSLNGGLTMPMGDVKDWQDTLGAKTGYDIGLTGGYYFSSDLVAGVYFDYARLDSDQGSLGFRFYNTGIYTKYSFSSEESNFEPFVKVSGGFCWPKLPTEIPNDEGPSAIRELSYNPGFTFGLHGGVLYYTSEFSGLFFELSYHNNFLDGNESIRGDEYLLDVNPSYLEMKLGVTAFFGTE